MLSFLYDRRRVKEELDMCVTDIKYDQVISNDSLSYYFKMQDAREEGREEGITIRTLTLARSFKRHGGLSR